METLLITLMRKSVEEKKKKDFEYLQESQSVLTEDDIIAEEKAKVYFK